MAVAATVLVAVLGHLPAADGFLFGDDWRLLARAAEGDVSSLLHARPLFTGVLAPLAYRLFQLHAVAYKTSSLLIWGLCTLLTVRVARHLGQRAPAALVAGLVAASTPLVIDPIFGWAASSRLWAATLALAAMDRWLVGGLGAGALAVALAVAAALLDPSALGVGALLMAALALGLRARGEGPTGREGWILAAVAVASTVTLAAGLAWRIDVFGGESRLVSGPRELLLRAAACGGWLVSPGRFAPGDDPLLACLGTLVWVAWLDLASRRWAASDRSVLFAWAWATIAVATLVVPARNPAPHQLVLAVPAVGWAVGAWVGPLVEAPLRRRAWPTFAAVVFTAWAVAGFATTFGASMHRLYGRDANRRLRHPDVVHSRMATLARRALESLTWNDADDCLCVLTPREPKLAPDAPAERRLRILRKVSPVHVALAGQAGLRLMLPDSVTTQWRLDLDGVEGGCQVLLDRGRGILRPIGTADNTRLSLALEAVNLGRHQEALDLLLAVLGEGGKTIRYQYDADGIGVSPTRLELMAPSFVAYLDEDGRPEAQTARDLFLELFAFLLGLTEEPEPPDDVVPPHR